MNGRHIEMNGRHTEMNAKVRLVKPIREDERKIGGSSKDFGGVSGQLISVWDKSVHLAGYWLSW